MKKLYVASHTGIDGIEIWLLYRAVDTTKKGELSKVKADIKAALAGRKPEEERYDPKNGTNFGPFVDAYDLSEAAYREIIRSFPDGDIPPSEWEWGKLGLTNEWDSHFFTLEGEEEPARLRYARLGSISTPKKAAASARNGQKGGRPKSK